MTNVEKSTKGLSQEEEDQLTWSNKKIKGNGQREKPIDDKMNEGLNEKKHIDKHGPE